MSYSKATLGAGKVWTINEAGGFFRILSSVDVVAVSFYLNGSLLAEVQNVGAGLWREGDFNRVEVRNMGAASNVVEVMIDTARVGYDRSAGSTAVTSLTPTRFTGSNTQKTVTTTSAQLVAALATRSYLLIQNNDATGNIWVRFGATAATTATGVKIGPGQSYELNCNITTGAIQAIGDIASNANIVVVEG